MSVSLLDRWRFIRRVGIASTTLYPMEYLSRRTLTAPISKLSNHVIDIGTHIGWPGEFSPRPSPYFEAHEPSSLDEIVVLGATIRLSSLEHLNRLTTLEQFHFHYLDWVAALPQPSDQCSAIWKWTEAFPARSAIAWHPYVTATRAWTLCTLASDCVPLQDDERLTGLLRDHYAVLWLNRERALGGNHLLRGYKALAGVAAYLGNDHLFDNHAGQFMAELEDQLLDDGAHIERSPSYHLQVLGDCVDVANLARSFGNTALSDRLDHSAERMRAWYRSVLHLDGSAPSFQDSPPLSAEFVNSLGDLIDGNRIRLGPSGYRVLDTGQLRLIMDVGEFANSGHARASALAIEVSDRQGVLIRNLGTSPYEPSERRHLERSVAGHNTVQIGSEDQAAFWGNFRYSRSPTIKSTTSGMMIDATHDGFSAPHRRLVRVAGDGFEVTDWILAKDPVTVVSRFHGETIERRQNSWLIGDRLQLDVTDPRSNAELISTYIVRPDCLYPFDGVTLQLEGSLDISSPMTVELHPSPLTYSEGTGR